MRYKLSDICGYCTEKVSFSEVDIKKYISTENMLPNKAGVILESTLPSSSTIKAFKTNDVLVSNIRPYFKKIWRAAYDGGCSNDVLVFRAKNGVCSDYLYYLLSDDNFFSFAMSTAKGTKMPRGDKNAMMSYQISERSNDEQKKIVSVLKPIDDKISINNKINKNLAA